jgi:E3 ubiquitin-protein ligase TRIP12
VNVKVAADGSKVEAATPDGTRVGTPTIPRSGTAASASPVPGSSARPTASPAPRPSYASALKKDESEWHLEFSMGEQDMHLDTTIYGGVHRFEAAQGSAISARTMWTNIYTVRYRKVSGPAASLRALASLWCLVGASLTTTTAQHGTPEPASRDNGGLLAVPDSIVASSKQGHILQLLRVLHTLNAELPVELGVGIGSPITALPEASFINNKLTAKMSRQLEEPMIVASSCLPGPYPTVTRDAGSNSLADWSLDLPQFYSFLFPFSTRYSFLRAWRAPSQRRCADV